MSDRDRLLLSDLRILVGSRVLVDGVGLELEAGRVVALVGASGSGKTLTARALLGMVDLQPGVVSAELEIRVDGRVLHPYRGCLGRSRRVRSRAFHAIRGAVVGYLAQDARASLDPLFTVGRQVRSAASLRDGGLDPDPLPWLSRAGFRDPERVSRLFPHELSGGMAQRAAIAMVLARGSRFLLADEPTTGLDPTVQREILDEVRDLRDDGIGILLITHDLRIIPGLADDVLVLDEGRLVECTTPDALRSGKLESAPGRELYRATRRVAGGRLG